MSSSQAKKRTVAQLRAEKEKRKQDIIDGMRLAMDVAGAYSRLQDSQYISTEVRYETLNTML